MPSEWSTGTARASGAQPLGESWWQAFEDPLLNRCVAAAIEHNRDLAAASARLAAAFATRDLSAAPLSPQVDAQWTGNRSRRLFLGFPFGGGGVPTSTTTTYGLNVNVTWELDLWGRLRSADAAAIAELQAQEADYHGFVQSLCAQTCKAYFAVVEARQQLALSEATAATVEATTQDTRSRFQRGVRPAVDTFQSETNLSDAKASVALRQRQLQTAIRQLEVLMGRYPAEVTESRAGLDHPLRPVPAGIPSDLLERRPDLAAAERRLAASGCRVDVARKDLYPRFSLTASGGTTSTELEDLVDDSFNVWSVGANVLQPLLRGGALRAELRRSEARQQEALADYGGSLLRAFAEVEIALADSKLLERQQQAAQSAADNAARARDLARDRYQQGLDSFLAVAEGQRRAFQSESTAINIKRQRIDNHIDLILALGGSFAQSHGSESEQPTASRNTP